MKQIIMIFVVLNVICMMGCASTMRDYWKSTGDFMWGKIPTKERIVVVEKEQPRLPFAHTSKAPIKWSK